MNITLTLTEDEAHALFDVLEHTSNDIGERLPDCKDDPDAMALWAPMFDISQRVMSLIEAETVEAITKGKPSQCPSCGNTDWATIEQTGADAHCDHQEERNFSCSECGCRFDEVWAYSHKEITHKGKQCECDEPERETRDGGRSVICTACGRDAS